ncbi:MAG: GGDEF domain-containing protein [candidate division WOR-3 bacterium]
MKNSQEKILKILEDFSKKNLWELNLQDIARKIGEFLGTDKFSIFFNDRLVYHWEASGNYMNKSDLDEKHFVQENYKKFLRFLFHKNNEVYHLYFNFPRNVFDHTTECAFIERLLNLLSQTISIRDFSKSRIIESQIINELNLNVITTLNEQKIIWYIESAAKRMLNMDVFLFYAVDDKLIGRDRTYSLKILSNELYHRLFKERQISYVRNGNNKFLKPLFKNRDFTEAIFIPFMIKGDCRGFFVLLNGTKNFDQKYFITKLKFLGNQASIALERIELFGALNRALKESHGLQEIARIMLTPYELRLVFDELLRRAQRLLGFKKILLSLYNPDTQSFDRINGIGISKRKLKAAQRVHPPVDVIKNLFKDCYRISHSYYIPAEEVDDEIHKYKVYKTRPAKKRIEKLWASGDILLSPIYSRDGGLLAILSLDEPYANLVPSMEKIRLLEAFGDFLGLAIENHNLFKKIESLSYTDELTGLYNYRFFKEKLSQLIEKKVLPISIVMVDLDGFKMINDRHGHLFGDEILKITASSLFKAVGRNGFVTRYGGDEFIIILPKIGIRGAKNRIKEFERILAANSNIEKIGFSCGIALYPENGKNFAELIDFADKKLYLEKRQKYGQNKTGVN